MNPGEMEVIINRKRYSTKTATLLAHDVYWDGHNMERSGRNTWLYRTPKGNYFVLGRTMWQGEEDSITPVTLDEAITLYEGPLKEHEVTYEEAFPDVDVEDA